MTRRLPASEVRKDLSTALNRVAFGGERLVLQRRGKDVAAVVSVEDLALLEDLEDRRDVEAARKALADPKNRKPIPWTVARKRLLAKK
jgi:prevent-host-death family protein